MSNEIIQIDLADKDACALIEHYIVDNFSDPSVKLFEELTEDAGLDVDRFYAAAGKAVLNEVINIALIQQIEKIEKENGE